MMSSQSRLHQSRTQFKKGFLLPVLVLLLSSSAYSQRSSRAHYESQKNTQELQYIDVSQVKSIQVTVQDLRAKCNYSDIQTSNTILYSASNCGPINRAKALIAKGHQRGIQILAVNLYWANTPTDNGYTFILGPIKAVTDAITSGYEVVRGNSGGFPLEGFIDVATPEKEEGVRCDVFGGSIITSDSDPQHIMEISLKQGPNGRAKPWGTLDDRMICRKVIAQLQSGEFYLK